MNSYTLNFVKIDINILSNPKIRVLRTYPEADTLCWTWISLITMAMQSKRLGYIELAKNRPYSPEELSNLLDIKPKTLKLALQAYEDLQMIDTSTGIIHISDIENHQSIGLIEHKRELNRIRKQKQRANEKIKALDLQHESGHVTHDTVTCHAQEKRRKEKTKKREDLDKKQTFRITLDGYKQKEESHEDWKSAYPLQFFDFLKTRNMTPEEYKNSKEMMSIFRDFLEANKKIEPSPEIEVLENA